LHDLTRAGQSEYDRADAEIAAALQARLPHSVRVIDVWNKADAADATSARAGLTLSARTGEGLQALRQQLLQQAGWQQASEGLFMARERHVQALHRVREHLEVASAHLAAHAQNLDLLAEELRLGQNALNEITGAFSADDLLGVIFSSFCIGK
jgi:tRNA modification GTPase